MANYTAADVKKLRESTGAGMMACKSALEEAEGNHDKAIEILRIKGLKSVSKREGRSATNGLVAASVTDGVGVMIELNCETDFVAKGEKFIALGDQILAAAVDTKATSAEDLLAATDAEGKKISDVIDEAGATIGEKLVLNRVARVEAPQVESYLHKRMPDLPPQIGVLLGLTGDAGEHGRGIAMHAAAMNPRFVTRDQVDEASIAKEREIIEQNARAEGKPEAAMQKIIEGRLGNFFGDIVLLDQNYAKDPKRKVADVLAEAGVEVVALESIRIGG